MAMSVLKKLYVSTAAALAIAGGGTYGYGQYQQNTTLSNAYAMAAQCQQRNLKNTPCPAEELAAVAQKQANENVKGIGAAAAGGAALMSFGLLL